MINENVPKNVSKAIMQGLTLSHEMRVQTVTELVTLLFDQPEYNSERLSSSSTTSIPLGVLRAAKDKQQSLSAPNSELRKTSLINNQKPRRKKRKSRKKVFVTTGGLTLLVGLCVMLTILINDLPDSSGTALQNSDINAVDTSVSSFEQIYDTGNTTTPPVTETIVTTPATIPAAIYIMDDIIGGNYDIISNTEKYTDSLVFNPEFEFNDTIPKGSIFYQSIPKGGTYQNGDTITVKVSNGPKYVTIPDYAGLKASEYFILLNESGIKYEQIEEMSTVIFEGYVIKTSKNAGEQLDNEIGEILTVYVATNPPRTETSPVTSESVPESGEVMIDIPF
jgi:serine/threonine-protein kinase